MMRFEPVPKPPGFCEQVELPGAEWLAKNPGAQRPRDYWSPFRSQLANGFRSLCAYSAMYEPVGTVDHFVSWDEDRSRAYDWANYRYAAGWINSSKKNVLSSDIIDPFDVKDGWFEILLPSLQLVATAAIPSDFRQRAEFVLRRLHLGNDERVIRQRQSWYQLYRAGELPLSGLWKVAPLLAAAVEKELAGS